MELFATIISVDGESAQPSVGPLWLAGWILLRKMILGLMGKHAKEMSYKVRSTKSGERNDRDRAIFSPQPALVPGQKGLLMLNLGVSANLYVFRMPGWSPPVLEILGGTDYLKIMLHFSEEELGFFNLCYFWFCHFDVAFNIILTFNNLATFNVVNI